MTICTFLTSARSKKNERRNGKLVSLELDYTKEGKTGMV